MYGTRYPTWRALARDYLAIMASSVASERAFSSAGITISNRHNRLDSDIVEALQGLKSLLHQDLIWRALPTVAEEELLLDDTEDHPANRQEESMHDAVKGADEWVWEEVKDSDGDIGRASSGYSNASEDGELA